MQYTTILTPELQAFGLTHGVRRVDSGHLDAAFRTEEAAIRFQRILNGAAIEDTPVEQPGLKDPPVVTTDPPPVGGPSWKPGDVVAGS